MRQIRAVVAGVCILCAAYGVEASVKTAGRAAPVAVGSAARPDAAITAAPRYKEAEPVLNVVTRERPRPAVVVETPRKGMRLLVDALLLATALGTVLSFWRMRKPKDSGDITSPRSSRYASRGSLESSPPAPESGPERERPPHSPRECAERLKSRRNQLAEEIERLMKRV